MADKYSKKCKGVCKDGARCTRLTWHESGCCKYHREED